MHYRKTGVNSGSSCTAMGARRDVCVCKKPRWRAGIKFICRWTATVLLCAQPVMAEDIAGLVAQCDGCHGEQGVSQWADMPTIAGISAFVHSDALLVYQERGRPCRTSEFRTGNLKLPATDMCAVAANLTEAQIDTLASHYAAKPFEPASQAADPALAEQGREIHQQNCGRCHTDDGSNPLDDASLLKGQWMDYLRQTFTEYQNGEREQPKKMKATLDPLDEKEREALVHFYGLEAKMGRAEP